MRGKILIGVVVVVIAVLAFVFVQNGFVKQAQTPSSREQPSTEPAPTEIESGLGNEPSPSGEVTIIEAESGGEVESFGCDASCGDWVMGSCVFNEQYSERLCICDDTGGKFYETKTEPATC